MSRRNRRDNLLTGGPGLDIARLEVTLGVGGRTKRDRTTGRGERCRTCGNYIYVTEQAARYALARINDDAAIPFNAVPNDVRQCGNHWHLTRRKEHPRCPLTGSVIYPTEDAALTALNDVQSREPRANNPPTRIRWCEVGEHWHLALSARPKCRHTNRAIFDDEGQAMRALTNIQRTSKRPSVPTHIERCSHEKHWHLAREKARDTKRG